MKGEFMTLETAKIKALFPEEVEAVVVRKDDYDRLYGDLTLENIELKQTLESIEKYIRKYDTNTLDTKTLCILNDILLIKNGVIRRVNMIICINLEIIASIIAITLMIMAIKDEDLEVVAGLIVMWIIVSVVLLAPFIALDKSSGQTIGTITSVDKNFFGSTAIWVKTSETEQEKYCAENEKVIEHAKELIGKKVKISYGTRVGLYPLDKCHEAPIDEIEEIVEGEE